MGGEFYFRTGYPAIMTLVGISVATMTATNSGLILVLSSIVPTAHGIKGGLEATFALPLVIAAFLGGLGGATLAETKLSPRLLQRIFAVIVLVAAIKAVFDVFSK